MAFLICWFIVILQFLWMYVQELTGRGLELIVIGKIIYYAAMSFVPLALPLGILLGSLIFFGNLGERLELLAIRAAGISLLRLFYPLFTVVVALAVGLFFFENTYMIKAQVKMWTLIYSARASSLELELPEGTFYRGLDGYSIFVKKRSKEHEGRMEDIMLYQYNGSNLKTRIIRADSGRIVMDKEKTYLTWRLYNGQCFQNLETDVPYNSNKPISHGRERFKYKEIVIPFDANFKEMDQKEFSSLYIGKRLNELETIIDSTRHQIDSIRTESGTSLLKLNKSQRYKKQTSLLDKESLTWIDSIQELTEQDFSDKVVHIKPDSIFLGMSIRDSLAIVRKASSDISYIRSDAYNSLYNDKGTYHTFRTNSEEWHRKFTYPVACIIFFLIGSSLGTIIRKGGIGMPTILSIIFFLIYYVLNTFGHNMIVKEAISVPKGAWLSTFILLPIGLMLMYQAIHDSSVLNLDTYINAINRLLGKEHVREYIYKEIVFEEADYQGARQKLKTLTLEAKSLEQSPIFSSNILKLWFIDQDEISKLKVYSEKVNLLVEELSNTKEPMLISELMEVPVIPKQLVWWFSNKAYWRLALLSLLPLSLVLSLYLINRRKNIIKIIKKTSHSLQTIDLLLESPNFGGEKQ